MQIENRLAALQLGTFIKGLRKNGSKFSGYITDRNTETIELTTAAKGSQTLTITSIKSFSIASSGGCGCRG